jgi:hypothetical protein
MVEASTVVCGMGVAVGVAGTGVRIAGVGVPIAQATKNMVISKTGILRIGSSIPGKPHLNIN